DRNVTGVQTCALPILGANVTVFTPQVPAVEIFGQLAQTLYQTMVEQVEVIPHRLTVDEDLTRFDCVVAAVGIEPAVEVAQDSGVTIDDGIVRSDAHTSELQSRFDIVCRLQLEKK